MHRNEDDARSELGISLAVADKLVGTYAQSTVSFLSNIQITAKGDEQRAQLKAYYTDAGIGGDDKKAKQFILDKFGRETYKSNISLNQAKKLWSYFQRLDMISRRMGVICSEMKDEALVTHIQQKIRAHSLSAVEQMLESFNFLLKVKAPSYLAIEAAAQSDVVSAPQRLYPTKPRAQLDPLDENAYEKKLEHVINSKTILGPEAFRLLLDIENEFSSGLNTLESAVHGAAIEGACAANSAVADAGSPGKQLIPYHQDYIAHYLSGPKSIGKAPVAEYYLALASETSPDLFLNPPTGAEKSERREKLNKIAKTDIRDRTSEIEALFAKHPPSYFVWTLSQRISALMENENVTDEIIGELLLQLGISAEQLNFYKIADMPNYNRFQIRFDALPLALTACLNRGVLLNMDKLSRNSHPWIFNPRNNTYVATASHAWIAQEWDLNRMFDLQWGEKTEETVYQEYSTQGSKRIVDTAGGTMFKQHQGSGVGTTQGSAPRLTAG